MCAPFRRKGVGAQAPGDVVVHKRSHPPQSPFLWKGVDERLE